MKFNLLINLKHKAWFLVFVAMTSFGLIQAQTVTIKGNVTGDGGPLPGVTVIIKGSSSGVVSDFDGNYEIKANPGDVLQFSFIGFVTKDVTVGSDTTINVTLKSDVSSLDEVVVIGYGTQKREEVQGAIVSVKAETITKSNTSDVASALQGQVAGVNVTASTGQPGANAVILIRGINSVFGSNEPLFVVDGIVQQDNPQLSPNEIESINVIKDAASAAVYGTRGSNGVILITTKQGKAGKMRVEVNSKYGVQKITSGVPLLNTEEIIKVEFARANNIDEDAQFDNTFNSLELNPFGLTNNSDITDIIENDYAPIQEHNLNISGGTKGLLFNLSGNFFSQEGSVVNSGLDRFNIRANTTYEKGRVKLTTSIGLRTDKQQLAPFNILLRAYGYKPYLADVDLNPGDITNIGVSPDNNDAQALGRFARTLKRSDFRETDDFIFTAQADIKLFDGLTFTSRGNFSRRNVLRTTLDPFFQILTDDGLPVIVPPRSGVRVGQARRNTFLFENYLTYNKYFGSHHITGTALYSAEEATNNNFFADGRDFLNDVVTNLGGTTDGFSVGGSENSNSLIGIMARAQYDYKGKYFLSGVVRFDASSRFPEQNRYVPLPSFSAAWIVSKEGFWESMGSTFNFLKLRYSYGTVGNQNLGDYRFQPVISIDRDAIFGSGNNEALLLGQIQDSFATSDLKWERKVESNFGIDMGFFDNKLTFTTEIYDGTREDMLFGVNIPQSVGSTAGQVTLNVGDMRNYGVELGAGYNHIAKNEGGLSFNVAGTYAKNENEITRMSETNKLQALNSEIAPGIGGPVNNDATTFLREGFEAGAFFLYETEGPISNEDELLEYQGRFAQSVNAQLGDQRFVDQITEDTDGDGVPDAGNGTLGIEDRVYKGSGAPEFELGLNFNASYKNFDISMQWYGSFGAEVLNGSKSFAYRSGTHRDLLNAWTPQNPTSTIPSDRGRDNINYRGFSDFWLEDGTFVRLRNIQLGYTFPTDLINKIGLNKARIFIASDNPLTLTKYSGFDPEVGNNGLSLRGIDRGNYPVVSQIRGGIQFNF